MLTQTRSGIGCFTADYELVEKIGEGTFSEVWRCEQRDSHRMMAAKMLKKTYGGPMDAAAWATIQEVNVTKSIDRHPYLLLVECAYHESDTGNLVLVTELMKRSLYDVIESELGPISDYRIKLYMYQLLEGIKYLHENNIIHRDVKPENILLSNGDRNLKIGDLGNACLAKKEHLYTEYVATRWYRSPECLLTRGRYGIKMDIWAAGCVLFEMATNRPLFDGADEDDQISKIDRVLGKPDSRLLDKFKRYKSKVFTKRYMSGETANTGVGLQSLYQPYRPGFDLIKEMIVYDPSKRSTAERLLRKSYFSDMKDSVYDQKVRHFEERFKKSSSCGFSDGEVKTKLATKCSRVSVNWKSKPQGPDGDRKSRKELVDATNVNEKNSTGDIQKRADVVRVTAASSKREVRRPDKQLRTWNLAKTSLTMPAKQSIKTASVATSNRVLVSKRNKCELKDRPPFK